MFKLSVIIPAAGSGVRMGTEIPKPFIRIGDKTILEHTIGRFLGTPGLIQIVVATSKGYFSEIKSIADGLPATLDFKVVEGGSKRQYSIYNALQHLKKETTLVAIHDAVRPFVRPELIIKCCEAADEIGGAVLGVPAKDTIKKVDGQKKIKSTPDRSLLWQAQTPQIFQKRIIMKAYETAIKNDFTGTDDASLVERIGEEIQMVEGDWENLKITYPTDLKIAELILERENE